MPASNHWPADDSSQPMSAGDAATLRAMAGHAGVDLIAAERRRQVEAEGWTPEHDDEHANGELIRAAYCYARHVDVPYTEGTTPAPLWPWHDDWWKPSEDPVRNLVKAGALIAAEIDRLQRLGNGSPQKACDRCTRGVMDSDNPHLRGECGCSCHAIASGSEVAS